MSNLPQAGHIATISPPDLRSILKWMFLLRLCLSLAILITGLILWREFLFSPRTGLVLLIVLASSLLVTAYGYWRLRSGDVDAPLFQWGQLLHDLFFISAVVIYTDGVSSAFTMLYVPLVAMASILFGMSGGVVFAAAVSTMFILLGVYQREFASAVVRPAGLLPQLPPPNDSFLLTILLLVILFFLVAVITAFLRDRLVTARARVRELETEIKFITIDTRDILDNIESGVVSIDSRGSLAFINRKAMELLEIKLLTHDPEALWRELAARAPALGRLLLDTLDFRPVVSRGEVQLESAHGQHVPLGITTNLLYDDRGARRGVTAVFRDISQVKRMEELSRQRDRLAAIAELSASLAHEIKNPLASIRTSVELLSTDAPAAGEEGRLHRLILKESDRLSNLLTDFMHFSRMELREEVPVALRELLSEAVELHFLGSYRPHPEIRIEWIGSRDPVVEGDHGLLMQLFQNLVLNAVQAVGDAPGGLITIAVSRDYAARAELYGIDPAGFVEIRVIDNGPGIQPEDLLRIFTPFFTTKPQGNGLGLAIVHRIVGVHGGLVFAESTPGAGAQFCVYLPLSSLPAPPKRRPVMAVESA